MQHYNVLILNFFLIIVIRHFNAAYCIFMVLLLSKKMMKGHMLFELDDA